MRAFLNILPTTTEVNLPLRLTNKAPRNEYVWGSGGVNPPLLISALDGDVWSASRPGRFTLRKIVRGTHWIGD
jgi:hypothetical protein